MTEILLIDGYNIINAWPELKKISLHSLDDARRRLIDIMQDFQGYKGNRIIIVFDSYKKKGRQETVEHAGNVEVVYTKENETADHYIERWTDNIQINMHVTVATSDFLQQTIILSKGAVRISARELLDQVKLFQKEIGRNYLEKPDPKSNTLGNWASPEIKEILERWRRQR